MSFLVFIRIIYNCTSQYQPTTLNPTLTPTNNSPASCFALETLCPSGGNNVCCSCFCKTDGGPNRCKIPGQSDIWGCASSDPTKIPTSNPSSTQSPSIQTLSPTVNTSSPTINTLMPTLITSMPTTFSPTETNPSINAPTANTLSPSINTFAPTVVTGVPTISTISPSETQTVVPTMSTGSPTNNSPAPTANNGNTPTINANTPTCNSEHCEGEENENEITTTNLELFDNKEKKVFDNDMSTVYIIIAIIVPINVIACIVIVYCIWIRKKHQKFVDEANKMKGQPDIFGNSIDNSIQTMNMKNGFQQTDPITPTSKSFYATVTSASNLTIPMSPGESASPKHSVHTIGLSQTEGFDAQKTGMNANDMNDINVNVEPGPDSLENQNKFMENRDAILQATSVISVAPLSNASDYDIGDVFQQYTPQNDNVNDEDEYDNIVTPGQVNDKNVCVGSVKLEKDEFIINGDTDEEDEYMEKDMQIEYATQGNDYVMTPQ
eukprot:425264_1